MLVEHIDRLGPSVYLSGTEHSMLVEHIAQVASGVAAGPMADAAMDQHSS